MSSSVVDVTVMIAAWKAEDFIGDAIISALSQQGVNLEVIVVDDCSPDNTGSAAMSAAQGDPRLIVIRMEHNGGPSRARNKAIEHASGRYVAVLDADDQMVPGRLGHLVEVADSSNADIIVDNMMRVNAEGKPLDKSSFLDGTSYEERMEIGLVDYVDGNRFMSGQKTLGYLKPLFRTETLREHRLDYDDSLRNSEDYYLVADMLALGARMIFEPFCGYLYRVDAGSISHRLKPELTEALIRAEMEFQSRHAHRLSRGQLSALKERLTRLRHAHAYTVFIDRLKAKHVIGAIGAFAVRPSALGFFSKQLQGILQQKLTA